MTTSLPPGWRDLRGLVGLAAVLSPAAMAWPLFQAGHAAAQREWLTALVMFGIAASVLLMVLGICRTMVGRARPRCTWSAAGTVFRPDRTLTLLLGAAAAILIPAAALFVVLTLRGGLDTAVGRDVRGAFLVGGAGAAALIGVVRAGQRGGIGYLRIGPAGIDDATITATTTTRWNDIAAIRGTPSTGKGRNTIVLVLRGGGEHRIQGAHVYVPTGAPLYRMVEFYLAHPELRPELTDGRAVDRVAALSR